MDILLSKEVRSDKAGWLHATGFAAARNNGHSGGLPRRCRMIQKLFAFWQYLRASLWAVPLVMVLAAAATGAVVARVKLDTAIYPAWFLYSGSSREVTEFLSNQLSAMITMATLAISITIVVLTLAAQQLGPRLIKSFMADLRTQVALGLFLSTVVYLIVVLRTSYGIEDGVPNLAVTIGTALLVCSVAALVLFVHHLATSIIADNMIDRVGADLDAAAERLLATDNNPANAARPASVRTTGAPIHLVRGGYIQAIDFSGLVAAASKHGALIEFEYRAGHHVIAGTEFGWVDPPKTLNSELQSAIESCVMLGGERTAVQDLEYPLRQLVEMALRALSPSVSDPFTALASIDRLSRSLEKMLHRGSAQSVWCDDDEKPRVIVPVSTFEGLVDAAFHQIRQLGADSPAVVIRLADNLGQLAAQATGERRAALVKHLKLVRNSALRRIEDESDRREIEARIRAALGPDNATLQPAAFQPT
jgi:uncharacterized membrane protein